MSMISILTLGTVAGCSTGTSTSTVPVKTDTTSVKTSDFVLNEYTIPAFDPGIELYLREKRKSNNNTSSKDEVVLFLEPFGVPTAEAFDVPGYSWMEDLAKQGYDTWALDIRGFGKSTRPTVMDKPPMENPPAVKATDGVRDVDAAVEFIQKSRNAEKVHIVGWSWGAVVASMYAIEHSEKVNKMVLYGGMHGFNLPSMTQSLEEKPGVLKASLPAYQLATADMTIHHWHMMMKDKELASKEAMDTVSKVFMTSDPTSNNRQPASIRRAMGPLVDLYYIWSNKPIFDAAKIKQPILIIRGDADFFADSEFINKLTGAAQKKEVVIKDATHWVLYEKNRDQLLSETVNFLRAK